MSDVFSENAIMSFGNESDQQPTLPPYSTPSDPTQENMNSTSLTEPTQTMSNVLDSVLPTQVSKSTN